MVVVKDNNLKTVKEVCHIVGITRKTLFYYDKVGLLKPSCRYGIQKHKMYNEKAISKLQEIRYYRLAGLEIQEIKDYYQKKRTMEEILQDVIVRFQNKRQQLLLEERLIKEINDSLRESSKISE